MKVVCIDDKNYRPHTGTVPLDAPKKGETLTVIYEGGGYLAFAGKEFVGYNKKS